MQHDVDSNARGTAVGYDDGHGRGGDARARRTRDARRYAQFSCAPPLPAAQKYSFRFFLVVAG